MFGSEITIIATTPLSNYFLLPTIFLQTKKLAFIKSVVRLVGIVDLFSIVKY